MDIAYLLLVPLAIELVLTVYVLGQNARGRPNRLFALFGLNSAIAICAVLILSTTTSPALAESAAVVVAVTIYVLNVPLLTGVVLALFYPRHLVRWYSLPPLFGGTVAFCAALVIDKGIGQGLFFGTMPEMGRGYVSTTRYMGGPLFPLLQVWFFGGVIVSVILLIIAWRRLPRGERAPALWLIFALLLSGSTSPLLPPHPFTPSVSPIIFSAIFALVVVRYRLFQPAQVSVGAIVQGAAEGMIILARDGTVEQMNPVAEQLTGVSAEKSRGRPFPEAFAAFLRQARQVEGETPVVEAIVQETTYPFEVVLRLESSAARVLRVAGVPIRDERGRQMGYLLSLRDVTEQELVRQALEERAHLAELIRELSSPIVPVRQGILILPLTGAIDSERAHGVLQDMLKAIRQHRARAILIDITGVPVVDTMVANYLLQAVQAAKLLGCQGILVGIRAEVARILVDLGLNLSGLVTKGSLQDGLDYALTLESKSTSILPERV